MNRRDFLTLGAKGAMLGVILSTGLASAGIRLPKPRYKLTGNTMITPDMITREALQILESKLTKVPVMHNQINYLRG